MTDARNAAPVVLFGNLAPEGCNARARLRRWIKGPVMVFRDGQAALTSVFAGDVHPGDILVVLSRSGSSEKPLASLAEVLRSTGWSSEVAVLTDGPAPADMAGIVVDMVRPSGRAGGPIGALRNGDVVIVAMDEGRIDALGDAARSGGSQPNETARRARSLSSYRTKEVARGTIELHFGLPNGGGTTIEELTRLAIAAEACGASAIWLYDHLLPPRSFSPMQWSVLEPLVVLTYLSSIVTRVRLGTSVLVLPMRNPFVVAKQVATLDILSGGRVTLGVGAGYSIAEFRNVHATFENRGHRLDEAILLLRHLFSGAEGPFEGQHYAYDDGVFAPLPKQGAALPIMVGGHTPAAVRRAATIADAWHPNGLDPHEYRRRLEDLDQLRGERAVVPGARFPIGEDADSALRVMSDWADAGASQLVVNVKPTEGDRVIERAAEAFTRMH